MIKILRRKPEKSALVALDIGTESVKAAVFTTELRQSMSGEVVGKRAMVHGYGKVHLKNQNSPIADLATVIRQVKEAIAIASEKARQRPSQLVMGIGGEFVKGATATFGYDREDSDSKVNVTELRNIVQKLQWQAFEKVRKSLSDETGYPEIDMKLIHSSVVDVKIDGYRVTNPLGFQGSKVTMSIFNAFAPIGYYDALQKIADELELELLGIVSEPFALSRCLDLDASDASAIFIDVGGSVTDIAVINEGAVAGSRMFGMGGRSFTKRLALELNVSLDEAESLKKAYTSDKLEQKSKQIISSIIQDDLEVWMEGVVFALSEFKALKSLPSRILLCGGGNYLPELKETLNNRKWYRKLPFSNTPQAAYLTPQNIRNVTDLSKCTQERGDILPLALAAMGLELASDDNVLQKVLRKVIGIMKV